MLERCWYEERVEQTGIPFISIKNCTDLSTLVFNPKSYEGDIAQFIFPGCDQVTKKILEKICSNCNLCQPEIEREKNAGFRIYRHYYNRYENEGIPLAEFYHLMPDGGKRRGVKVAFVDDMDPTRWAEILVLDGFEMLCVSVNANVRAREIDFRKLCQKIIEWEPDWLVSDKGLGFVDGVELIKQCKEAGIRTVMLTGEIQTAETRKVADFFLTKPTTYRSLLQAIETP
ncbi:hypothetical protein HYU95_05045 [Candidatus Daviesbacteria bacterium]|nr:hypothetical protein [Candidatus Daviesbacteria bacterium]